MDCQENGKGEIVHPISHQSHKEGITDNMYDGHEKPGVIGQVVKKHIDQIKEEPGVAQVDISQNAKGSPPSGLLVPSGASGVVPSEVSSVTKADPDQDIPAEMSKVNYTWHKPVGPSWHRDEFIREAVSLIPCANEVVLLPKDHPKQETLSTCRSQNFPRILTREQNLTKLYQRHDIPNAIPNQNLHGTSTPHETIHKTSYQSVGDTQRHENRIHRSAAPVHVDEKSVTHPIPPLVRAGLNSSYPKRRPIEISSTEHMVLSDTYLLNNTSVHQHTLGEPLSHDSKNLEPDSNRLERGGNTRRINDSCNDYCETQLDNKYDLSANKHRFPVANQQPTTSEEKPPNSNINSLTNLADRSTNDETSCAHETLKLDRTSIKLVNISQHSPLIETHTQTLAPQTHTEQLDCRERSRIDFSGVSSGTNLTHTREKNFPSQNICGTTICMQSHNKSSLANTTCALTTAPGGLHVSISNGSNIHFLPVNRNQKFTTANSSVQTNVSTVPNELADCLQTDKPRTKGCPLISVPLVKNSGIENSISEFRQASAHHSPARLSLHKAHESPSRTEFVAERSSTKTTSSTGNLVQSSCVTQGSLDNVDNRNPGWMSRQVSSETGTNHTQTPNTQCTRSITVSRPELLPPINPTISTSYLHAQSPRGLNDTTTVSGEYKSGVQVSKDLKNQPENDLVNIPQVGLSDLKAGSPVREPDVNTGILGINKSTGDSQLIQKKGNIDETNQTYRENIHSLSRLHRPEKEQGDVNMGENTKDLPKKFGCLSDVFDVCLKETFYAFEESDAASRFTKKHSPKHEVMTSNSVSDSLNPSKSQNTNCVNGDKLPSSSCFVNDSDHNSQYRTGCFSPPATGSNFHDNCMTLPNDSEYYLDRNSTENTGLHQGLIWSETSHAPLDVSKQFSVGQAVATGSPSERESQSYKTNDTLLHVADKSNKRADCILVLDLSNQDESICSKDNEVNLHPNDPQCVSQSLIDGHPEIYTIEISNKPDTKTDESGIQKKDQINDELEKTLDMPECTLECTVINEEAPSQENDDINQRASVIWQRRATVPPNIKYVSVGSDKNSLHSRSRSLDADDNQVKSGHNNQSQEDRLQVSPVKGCGKNMIIDNDPKCSPTGGTVVSSSSITTRKSNATQAVILTPRQHNAVIQYQNPTNKVNILQIENRESYPIGNAKPTTNSENTRNKSKSNPIASMNSMVASLQKDKSNDKNEDGHVDNARPSVPGEECKPFYSQQYGASYVMGVPSHEQGPWPFELGEVVPREVVEKYQEMQVRGQVSAGELAHGGSVEVMNKSMQREPTAIQYTIEDHKAKTAHLAARNSGQGEFIVHNKPAQFPNARDKHHQVNPISVAKSDIPITQNQLVPIFSSDAIKSGGNYIAAPTEMPHDRMMEQDKIQHDKNTDLQCPIQPGPSDNNMMVHRGLVPRKDVPLNVRHGIPLVWGINSPTQIQIFGNPQRKIKNDNAVYSRSDEAGLQRKDEDIMVTDEPRRRLSQTGRAAIKHDFSTGQSIPRNMHRHCIEHLDNMLKNNLTATHQGRMDIVPPNVNLPFSMSSSSNTRLQYMDQDEPHAIHEVVTGQNMLQGAVPSQMGIPRMIPHLIPNTVRPVVPNIISPHVPRRPSPGTLYKETKPVQSNVIHHRPRVPVQNQPPNGVPQRMILHERQSMHEGQQNASVSTSQNVPQAVHPGFDPNVACDPKFPQLRHASDFFPHGPCFIGQGNVHLSGNNSGIFSHSSKPLTHMNPCVTQDIPQDVPNFIPQVSSSIIAEQSHSIPKYVSCYMNGIPRDLPGLVATSEVHGMTVPSHRVINRCIEKAASQIPCMTFPLNAPQQNSHVISHEMPSIPQVTSTYVQNVQPAETASYPECGPRHPVSHIPPYPHVMSNSRNSQMKTVQIHMLKREMPSNVIPSKCSPNHPQGMLLPNVPIDSFSVESKRQRHPPEQNIDTVFVLPQQSPVQDFSLSPSWKDGTSLSRSTLGEIQQFAVPHIISRTLSQEGSSLPVQNTILISDNLSISPATTDSNMNKQSVSTNISTNALRTSTELECVLDLTKRNERGTLNEQPLDLSKPGKRQREANTNTSHWLQRSNHGTEEHGVSFPVHYSSGGKRLRLETSTSAANKLPNHQMGSSTSATPVECQYVNYQSIYSSELLNMLIEAQNMCDTHNPLLPPEVLQYVCYSVQKTNSSINLPAPPLKEDQLPLARVILNMLQKGGPCGHTGLSNDSTPKSASQAIKQGVTVTNMPGTSQTGNPLNREYVDHGRQKQLRALGAKNETSESKSYVHAVGGESQFDNDSMVASLHSSKLTCPKRIIPSGSKATNLPDFVSLEIPVEEPTMPECELKSCDGTRGSTSHNMQTMHQKVSPPAQFQHHYMLRAIEDKIYAINGSQMQSGRGNKPQFDLSPTQYQEQPDQYLGSDHSDSKAYSPREEYEDQIGLIQNLIQMVCHQIRQKMALQSPDEGLSPEEQKILVQLLLLSHTLGEMQIKQGSDQIVPNSGDPELMALMNSLVQSLLGNGTPNHDEVTHTHVQGTLQDEFTECVAPNQIQSDIYLSVDQGESPVKYVQPDDESIFSPVSMSSSSRSLPRKARHFFCNECNITFQFRWELRKHNFCYHRDSYPFKCDQCPFATNALRQYSVHALIHKGVRPFKCDVCGSAFTQMGNLYKHKKHLHSTERPYVCMICHRGFPYKHGLVSHMRIHTGEKPFECDVCEYRCAEQGALKKHKMIHTGDKPHKCHYLGCNAAFVNRLCWVKHVSRHKKFGHVVDPQKAAQIKSGRAKRAPKAVGTNEEIRMHSQPAGKLQHSEILERSQMDSRPAHPNPK